MMGHGPARASFSIRSVTIGYFGAEGFLSMVYSAADLFILPTLEDNLLNTAIEAISCGVPVVVFKVGGIGEIIHDGHNGRLVPVGDVEGLRFAICESIAPSRNPQENENKR
jgi:glycosyltransferase involved in cell wall biosynthesis